MAIKDKLTTLEDVKVVSDYAKNLANSLAPIQEQIIGRFTGSVQSDNVPYIRLAIPCNIKQGDVVTISASYTGTNTNEFDLRAYDSGNTIHVIKSHLPFDTDYTFVASGNYVSVDLYHGSLNPIQVGETFSASVTINGVMLSKVQTLDAAVENIENTKDNYYDGITLTAGRVTGGVIYSSTTMHYTDYIPIVPNHKYAVYGGFFDSTYNNYYDSNKNYVGAMPLTEYITAYPYNYSRNIAVFTAPSNARFMRVNFLDRDLESGALPADFYFRDITNSKWADKKFLVIGDSISADYYGGYPKWVTDLLRDGLFLINNLTNDSIHATGFVARYSSTADDTFLTRLQTHSASDFDYLILFGGINDFIQNINFDTFKTAVDAFFSYLASNWYGKRIIVFSPLRTFQYGQNNSVGHTQKEYIDYIKEVAKYYALPLLNLTDDSGFFPYVETFKNQWTLMPDGQSTHDGVHPTETWEKEFLVPMVKQFLSSF